MDNFEQGLQGSIRSMIVDQTFKNFQEIYQRAVKIARVLEETERENRATNLEKRKMEYGNRGPRSVTLSSLTLVDRKIRASNPWLGRTDLFAEPVANHMWVHVLLNHCDVMDAERWDMK